MAGFRQTVPDYELSFRGPATPEVVVAWQKRFERMTLLQKFCASEFENVREELLSCLTRPEHLSTARVVSCIASKTPLKVTQGNSCGALGPESVDRNASRRRQGQP